MIKKLIFLLLAVAMLLSLAACGGSADTTEPVTDAADVTDDTAEAAAAYDLGDKVLRVAIHYDMATMDMAMTTDNYFIPHNIFNRLFEIRPQAGGDSQLVNSLCSDWSVSDDGLTYTFQLVEGVTFSNGNPLTAEDVKYSFERLLTIPGGVNYDIAIEIAGAEALLEGEVDTLDSIVVNGDYELSITLEAPNAGFVTELASPAMSIVDKETCESVDNFGMEPADTIGSGPYIITEWVVNDHCTMVRNDNYWGEAPTATAAIVQVVPEANTQNLMFQSGELDMIDLEYIDSSIIESVYQTAYADSIVEGHYVGVTFMTLNENNEYLSDVNVRKAIQMAIDRQALLDAFYSGAGIVENGMIATGVWGHNDDLQPITYDPEAARQLLADAGYEEGEITFEFSVNSEAGDDVRNVCQKIAQDLEAVGIIAELKFYDNSAWLDFRRTEEMPAFVGTWTMDFNDPANIMGTFFSTNTAGRSINYYNEEVKERVDAATAILDDDERMAEYQALEEIIVVDDAAVVPLFEKPHLFAINTETVESFTTHWSGMVDFFISDVVMK